MRISSIAVGALMAMTFFGNTLRADELDAQIALLKTQLAAKEKELNLALLKKQISEKQKKIDEISGKAASDKKEAEKKARGTKGKLGEIDIIGFAAPNLKSLKEKEKRWWYQPIVRENGASGRIKSDGFRPSNLGQWDIDYSIGKLGTRIYFDIGSQDEGEVDYFADGKMQASIDMINLYAHRPFVGTDLDWGPNVAIGIAAGGEGEDASAATLMASYGLFLRPKDAMWQLEAGAMTAISAGDGLNSTTRDDTAIYLGVSVGSLLDSSKQKVETKKK